MINGAQMAELTSPTKSSYSMFMFFFRLDKACNANGSKTRINVKALVGLMGPAEGDEG